MATDDQAYPPGAERPNSGPVVAPATGSEIDRLRKRNSELQRRCQQAESAVMQFKADWDKSGGPRGGSFGRALLACYCQKLEDALREIANLNTGFSKDADEMNRIAREALGESQNEKGQR